MIKILQGDITTLSVDAIVNAANNSLLGGGGVDGAIHRAAGPELLRACHALYGCETGQAKITPGFQLPAKWVVHTVGPVWSGGHNNEPALLESCYRQSFKLSLVYQAKTIAFPAISTGVYGYPKQQAAVIAMAIMQQYDAEFDEIIACCFDSDDYELYKRTLSGFS